MSENVVFNGSFDELMSKVFVDKKIRCNNMEHYDEEFHRDYEIDANNVKPKIVPSEIVLVKNVLFEDYWISINKEKKLDNNYRYCIPIDCKDCVIEIIE